MFLLTPLHSGGNSGIRRTWERLSDGKAFVTASDLELYAKNNGLPTSYALSFATAVLGAAPSDGEEISYRAFANFVKSRESALRLAFNHFGEHHAHGVARAVEDAQDAQAKWV